jgi:hypothetical protein
MSSNKLAPLTSGPLNGSPTGENPIFPHDFINIFGIKAEQLLHNFLVLFVAKEFGKNVPKSMVLSTKTAA